MFCVYQMFQEFVVAHGFIQIPEISKSGSRLSHYCTLLARRDATLPLSRKKMSIILTTTLDQQ